jgi:hypothetical protein
MLLVLLFFESLVIAAALVQAIAKIGDAFPETAADGGETTGAEEQDDDDEDEEQFWPAEHGASEFAAKYTFVPPLIIAAEVPLFPQHIV